MFLRGYFLLFFTFGLTVNIACRLGQAYVLRFSICSGFLLPGADPLPPLLTSVGSNVLVAII